MTLADSLEAGVEITNTAEISRALDENGDEQTDFDSTPDTLNNDTFLSDNDVSGNGNDGEDEDDHDIAVITTLSFDLALIKELADGQSSIVRPGDTIAYDITVINQGDIPADSIVISDYIDVANMMFEAGAGDGIETNAGNGWTVNVAGDVATDTIFVAGGLQPGEDTTVTIFLTLNSPIAPGVVIENVAEITSSTDENGDDQIDDDSTPDDDDSNDEFLVDNDVDGDGKNGGDEDDHDKATVETAGFDLALVKLLSDGQDRDVEPGDTISYDIVVINQGMIAADSIEITDYLPVELTFTDAINPDWSDSTGFVQTLLTVADNELPTGGLLPGDSTKATVLLILDAPLAAGTEIVNKAEISRALDENGDEQLDFDSDPDTMDDDTFLQDNEVSGLGNMGEDEDDHDLEIIRILPFDLALNKKLAVGQSRDVLNNDDVRFVINVFNQGAIPADSIVVKDFIPNGFIFNVGASPSDWTISGDTAQYILSVASGTLTAPLAPGDSTSIEITLTVSTLDPAITSLVNVAEIAEALDENGNPTIDDDSTPDSDQENDTFLTNDDIDANGKNGGDEDDHDKEEVNLIIPDIGIAKREVNVMIMDDGCARITYEINVENLGNATIDSLQVIDDLDVAGYDACGGGYTIKELTSSHFLVDSMYNGSSDSTLLTGVNDLRPGEKGAIILVVDVCGCADGTTFTNSTYVFGDDPTGRTTILDNSSDGSDPDPSDDGEIISDESSATVTTLNFTPIIGVAKRVSQGPVNNEDGTYDLTFEISVENFGTVNLDSVQVAERLDTAFADADAWEVLSVESEEFDENLNFDGVTDTLLLTGNDRLLVGNEGAIYVTVRVTPGDTLTGYLNQVRASAEAPNGDEVADLSQDGSEPDLDQDGDPTNDNVPTPIDFEQGPGLNFTKRLAEGPALDAENWYVMTFELKVENTGDVDLGMIQVEEPLETRFALADSFELLSIISEEFEIDTAYTGRGTDTDLLTGLDTLEAGDEGAIYVKIRVAPGCQEEYENKAIATAVDPQMNTLMEMDTVDLTLPCFVEVICPSVVGPIVQENDLGMCGAVVNFDSVRAESCAGSPTPIVQYRLTGVGAMDVDNDIWIVGQPSGLMYNVGVTTVEMRAIVVCGPADTLFSPTTCSLDIDIRDKQPPTLLCQDITVGVTDMCDYTLEIDDIDAGAFDNCGVVLREIGRDTMSYADTAIVLTNDDLLVTPITIFLRVTDAAGNQSECTVEVNLEDRIEPDIICPPADTVYAAETFCSGKIPDLMGETRIDNCLPIDTVIQSPPRDVLWGQRHLDSIDVVLTIIDIDGNRDSCATRLTLIDTVPPEFLNCPRPDIRVNTLPGMCAAFVNFSLPTAIDNCTLDTIIQTDTTGLTSGDMFEVGTTILEYEAFDVAGNSSDCFIKVIVNDKADPEISCPIVNNPYFTDPGDCGTIVNDLDPVFSDNCPDNAAVVYKVENAGEQIASGLDSASGLFFPQGTNLVTYRVQDQPLFLITEVTQDIDAVAGGMNPNPFTVADVNGDYLEVTNFGPASLDVSCMLVQRITIDTIESYSIPFGIVLGVGDVLTIHFGEGTDDTTNFFFNVPGTVNLASSDQAAYVIGHSGTVLDVVALNGFNPAGLGDGILVPADEWTGTLTSSTAGVIRTSYYDNDNADDFRTAEVCDPLTIGMLNTDYVTFTDNGATTSLQSQKPRTDVCTFNIIVEDKELPNCGAAVIAPVYMTIENAAIMAGDCFESTIMVDSTFDIADVDVYIEGVTNATDFGNLRFRLISPEGTEIVLVDQACGTGIAGYSILFESNESPAFDCAMIAAGDSLAPIEDLNAFLNEAAFGDWTLEISHNASVNMNPVIFTEWRLDLKAKDAYNQMDITVNNDTTLCSAEVEWVHPILFDNCPSPMNSLTVKYYEVVNGSIGAEIGSATIPQNDWGDSTSYVFPVGVTFVEYTLMDASGNTNNCGFEVTVIDNEPPTVVCLMDTTIQLGSGECEILLPEPVLTTDDNCMVDNVTFDPPYSIPFPIGTTPVTVYVEDVNGNIDSSCTYNVIVDEFIPDPVTMACYDKINVTLGPDCMAEITPGMILSGENYRCFDNYLIAIKTSHADNAPVISTSPFVTLDNAGQTLVVVVCDPVTGDCCWAEVSVDHKINPDFDVPADTALVCNALDTAYTGWPVITSCIDGEPSISYQDQIIDNGDCADTTIAIIRTWRVEDQAGRFTEKIQNIYYKKFELNQLAWPANYDNVDSSALSCSFISVNPQELSPDSLGYPTLTDGTSIFGVHDYCDFSYAYSDERFEICEGSYEILRTWKIRDLCQPLQAGVNPVEHIQLIQVLDEDGPEIEIQDSIVVYSTTPFNCVANYVIPEPTVIDSCSSYKWSVSVSGGALFQDTFGVYTVYNLEVDQDYTVTYRAKDACGRFTRASYLLQVRDLVKPIMKCDDELRVTLVDGDDKLGIKGYALATVEDVDEGSWDNCGLVDMKVRRAVDNNTEAADDYEAKYGTDYREDYIEETGYSKWDDLVEFFCSDTEGPVEVQLRGVDKSGNVSTCWMNIDLENGTSSRVVITEVGDLKITCDEDFVPEEHFEINTGNLTCVAPEIAYEVIPEVDQCGIGKYIIAFSLKDTLESKNGSVILNDTIEVDVYPVHNYWVKFPADEVYDCGQGLEVSGPEFSEDVACDLLAVSTTEDEFTAAPNDPDACYKIFRTYRVINWCEYDGEALPVIVSRDWDAHNDNGIVCNQNANQEGSSPDAFDAGEYNLNPSKPDGDGTPGDEDIYVIVDINEYAGTGIVYYDNDSDPTNNSTADLFGDDDVSDIDLVAGWNSTEVGNGNVRNDEGYWWAVTLNNRDCDAAGSTGTSTTSGSRWEDTDLTDVGQGSPAQDDDDNRYGSHGFWQYTQHIIVYDDTAPEATIIAEDTPTISNFDCAANTSIQIIVTDPCSVQDITASIKVNGVLETGAMQVGTDSVIITVEKRRQMGPQIVEVTLNDGCGNTSTVTDTFEVYDGKAPAPICQDGIVVELMPAEGGGAIGAVWASDFIASPIGDCMGQSDSLVNVGNAIYRPMISKDAYSIYRLDSIEADSNWQYSSPFDDSAVRGVNFTCDDLDGDEGLVMVRVYAEDKAGNSDFCVGYVRIQDNMNACSDSTSTGDGAIAGLVATEDVNPVEDTEVQLSGAASMMYMTTTEGDYGFVNLAEGNDYTVTPRNDLDHRNGVSTFDLILIQKHILGNQLLDSPYKLIAADANNSKTVSTLDLIQIRKLILNIDTEFSKNTSWRFVDADYVFPDPLNPWSEGFPEIRNVNNLEGTEVANFTAVKIGDINGSARANSAQLLSQRNVVDVLEITTAEVEMKQGNTYRVSFRGDLDNIAGYQFTMDFDQSKVSIVDVKEGIAKANNFGVFKEEGIITTSFHRSAAEEISGEMLFHLTLRANADAKLSEAIGISSRLTEAEAYDLNDEDMAVALLVGDVDTRLENALYQNMPNPFSAETLISFKLAEANEGIIEIKDIRGRTILLKEGDFARGYNEIRLRANELPAGGVYFYTLHAGDFTATRKMILTK